MTGQDQPNLEQLMAASQNGDQRAYARLLQILAGILNDFLARKVAPANREDIVQDILLSLHKARHTYTPGRPLLPWVMAIARYRLNDHWRAHYRQKTQATENIDDHAENLGVDVTETYAMSEDLRRAVQGLNPRQREIIEQMYGQDLSVQEVADKLQMNLSAVKVAAHRAYKAMRGRLGEN